MQSKRTSNAHAADGTPDNVNRRPHGRFPHPGLLPGEERDKARLRRGLHGNRAGGFSMIEVLVTLLILSVGLLGLAALQSIGLRYNVSAYQRTQATVLGYDILDRMRANRAAANSADYQTDLAADSDTYTTDCYSASANCSPSDLGQHDLREWKEAIEGALPNGQGMITDTPATGSGVLHQVTVRWIDDRNLETDDGKGTDQRYLSVTVRGEL